MPHRSRSDALETPGPKNKAGAAVSGGAPAYSSPLEDGALAGKAHQGTYQGFLAILIDNDTSY